MNKGVRRQIDFDIAKGIAILCVILGHLDVPWLRMVVFTFHMPIFFIISGYFLSTHRPMREFIRKKARGLLVPYYFTGLLICLGSIPISLLLHRDVGGEIWRWVAGTIYGGPAVWPIIAFWPSSEPWFIGAIWFLWALFWATLLVRAALMLPRRWTVVVVLVASFAAWATGRAFFLPLDLQPGLFAALFVLGGVYAREKNILSMQVKWYAVAAAILFLIYCLDHWHFFSICTLDIHRVRDIFLAFTTSWLVYLLSRRLVGTRAGRILAWYGENSLLILAFHIIELDLVPAGGIAKHLQAAGAPEFLLWPAVFWTLLFCCKLVWATSLTLLAHKIPLFRMAYNIRG